MPGERERDAVPEEARTPAGSSPLPGPGGPGAESPETDLLPPLGAHLSIAGGLHRAPERGRELGVTALQVFTKPPQRWAERTPSREETEAFRRAAAAAGIVFAAAHDSYLINLATADPLLHRRSVVAFRAELDRCLRLGLQGLVTHPGNATGGDPEAAIRRNASAIGGALEASPGETAVLLETTAGSGTALGSRFEELARLIEAIPGPVRDRVGICLDTAHVFAAGYDLREDYDGVIDRFDRVLGLDRLRLIHVNDSKAPLGSRVDRHAHIGQGELGEAPFAALMRDARLRGVPRVLETPKGDDPAAADRRNLELLRRLAGPGARGSPAGPGA